MGGELDIHAMMRAHTHTHTHRCDVLVGVDDMDMFKGIELKLQAFERLLDHNPELRGKVVLVQVRAGVCARVCVSVCLHLEPACVCVVVVVGVPNV